MVAPQKTVNFLAENWELHAKTQEKLPKNRWFWKVTWMDFVGITNNLGRASASRPISVERLCFDCGKWRSKHWLPRQKQNTMQNVKPKHTTWLVGCWSETSTLNEQFTLIFRFNPTGIEAQTGKIDLLFLMAALTTHKHCANGWPWLVICFFFVVAPPSRRIYEPLLAHTCRRVVASIATLFISTNLTRIYCY